MTITIAAPLIVENVELIASRRAVDSGSLWRVRLFVGLFRPSRDLLIVAPTRYLAACVADQIITGDEWFPSFSPEPIDIDIDVTELLSFSASGGASQ